MDFYRISLSVSFAFILGTSRFQRKITFRKDEKGAFQLPLRRISRGYSVDAHNEKKKKRVRFYDLMSLSFSTPIIFSTTRIN